MDDPRRENLLGLLFECPFHAANPADCPLHEVRQRDLEARTEWLEGLSEDEVAAHLAHHSLCLARKERD